MDYNELIQPNRPNIVTQGVLTNFLDMPEVYTGIYMISFSQLMGDDITDELIDGDFEEDEDLGNLRLGIIDGHIYREFPPILDDSQVDALIGICDVDFQFSKLLGIVIPVFTFRNGIIERILLDTPVEERSFYLHSGMMPWYRMMMSYMQGGPLELQDRDEMEWELGVLREDLQIARFAFAFNFLFYGTLVMGWVINGVVRPGLRGGAEDSDSENGGVDDLPPEPKRVSRKTPLIPDVEEYIAAPVETKKETPRSTVKETNRKGSKNPVSKKPLTCRSCGKPGHMAKDCVDKKCYICKKAGHMSNSCPNKGTQKTTRNDRGSQRRGAKKANLIQNNLVQSLQQSQGEADALREQANYLKEQVAVAENNLSGVLNAMHETAFERKPVGIKYRTDSAIVIEVTKVEFQMTALGNCVSKAFSLLNSCGKFITNCVGKTTVGKRIAREYETLFTILRYMNVMKEKQAEKIRKERNLLNILGWLFFLVKAKRKFATRRIGGLIHTVDLESLPSPENDVRLDYLAVGDLKHTDPEYCKYTVTAEIAQRPSILTMLGGVFELPMEYKFKTKPGPAIQESLVSKVAFKNLASFRLSPFTSDESARNSVLMSLTKMPSVNLSRHFIEDVNNDAGLSDEASTRTFEAIMAFRRHMCEQQVFRCFSKQFVLDKRLRRRPGLFIPDQEFIDKSLN